MSLIGPALDRTKQIHAPPSLAPPLPIPSMPMASASFPAFIGQSPVTILLDPSSESFCVSQVLVHKLGLPCSFGISGVQFAAANLHVPTDDGGYHSCLSLRVSYDLASDVVLGNDWLMPCEPILADNQSRIRKPLPSTMDRLPPLHLWHPTKRVLIKILF